MHVVVFVYCIETYKTKDIKHKRLRINLQLNLCL